jgi:hypothetical protein
MKQDRFLIGILSFIGLLVVSAVVLFFIRRGVPAYAPEDTPQGVLHNYANALLTEDYARAYGYLAEADNKPTLDAFRQAFLSQQLDVSTSAIQVDRIEITQGDHARIDVTVIYYEKDGLLARGWNSNQTASLIKQNGAWRIISMPYPFWSWNWYQPTPVK